MRTRAFVNSRPRQGVAMFLCAAGLVGWTSAAVGQVINIPFREGDMRLCGLCIPEQLTAQLNCALLICDGAEGGCSFFVIANPGSPPRIRVFCDTTLFP